MRRYLELFTTFFKIGTFTLGGGYAMLSLVERSIVKEKKWIEENQFWDMITVVQSLPGVFAVNTALYTGHRVAGVKGAATSFLGAVLPSIIIIGLISTFFMDMRENDVIVKIFKGIRPCVVALILAPSIRMYIKTNLSWKWLPVPLVVCALVAGMHVSPIIFIVIGIIAAVILAQRKGNINESITNKE